MKKTVTKKLSNLATLFAISAFLLSSVAVPLQEVSAQIAFDTTSTAVTTTQCEWIGDSLKFGGQNNIFEVTKLESFFKYFEGYSTMEVDGIFDAELFEAVKTFQSKYADEVLSPWGYTAPTGYVHVTTRNKINEIFCNREIPLTVAEQTEIREYRVGQQQVVVAPIMTRPISVDRSNDRVVTIADDVSKSEPGRPIIPFPTSPAVPDTEPLTDDTATTTAGSAEESTPTEVMLRGLAASVLALPETPSAAFGCIFYFAIVLSIIYVISSILVNSRENKGLNKKEIRAKKVMYFIIGTILAVILSLIFEVYCLVVPLLVVLVLLSALLLWFVNTDKTDAFTPNRTLIVHPTKNKKGHLEERYQKMNQNQQPKN